MGKDLTCGESHFAFGRNWASYAEQVGEAEIAEAEVCLRRLLPVSLQGLTLLDIGSGSGLHAVAALKLGASHVVAIDLDVDAVNTTRRMLERFAPEKQWEVHLQSVFDLDDVEGSSSPQRQYDVVYSWGVLHHTGDLHRALRVASACVAPGGRFAFALYRRTWLDLMWKLEKRWYSNATPAAQARARVLYRKAFALWLKVRNVSFSNYVANYRSNRGMDFEHDVHDWLGGWPYESISRSEVDFNLCRLDFSREHTPTGSASRLFGRDIGLFGSWCDEYVYRRSDGSTAATR